VRKLVLISTGPRVADRRRLVRLGMAISRLRLLRGQNPPPRQAVKAQFDANTRFDCTDRLGAITQPTLIVHGNRDHVAPVGMAEQMHAAINDAGIVRLDGGHLIAPLPQRREQLVSAIETFLDEPDGNGG
jgi:pimeloyl-ACP methyl ester carboxylesterase